MLCYIGSSRNEDSSDHEEECCECFVISAVVVMRIAVIMRRSVVSALLYR